jgi:stage II sporulation protein D
VNRRDTGRAAGLGVLGLVVLALAPAAAAGTSGNIRVALAERLQNVEVSGGEITVTGPGGCRRCGRRAWRTTLVRAITRGRSIEIDRRRGEVFQLRSGTPLRWNGRDYPGTIELARTGEGIVVVNEVGLEEYLVGVLRAEVGDQWPLEALRAQAIVARTYAAYHRRANQGKPYHIVASVAHQQYAGRVGLASPAWEAVRSTVGQVLRWEGELFPAFYHTESGGVTEDPRTVFAARNMPALVPVACPFSVGSPHYHWNLDLPLTELAEILRRHELAVGPVLSIDVPERSQTLRAMTVTVRGELGSVRLRGNDFRRMIGYDTLRSTLFAVSVRDGIARFSGRGYGHGVGLCQWGARGMAEQGYTAAQILAYYYPGAVPGTLDGPRS